MSCETELLHVASCIFCGAHSHRSNEHAPWHESPAPPSTCSGELTLPPTPEHVPNLVVITVMRENSKINVCLPVRLSNPNRHLPHVSKLQPGAQRIDRGYSGGMTNEEMLRLRVPFPPRPHRPYRTTAKPREIANHQERCRPFPPTGQPYCYC